MTISRREALRLSGATIAGLSIGALKEESLLAQVPAGAAAPAAQQPAAPWPDTLTDNPTKRPGFPVELPLNPDGSAPEHQATEAGAISDPIFWRTPNRVTPEIDYDYKNLKVKIDTRGMSKLAGTLHFSDLEKLPRISKTYLLQCGAANPRGVVKWTGVRFSDFANILGLVPGVHYVRFVASDKMYNDEAMATVMHPQVMLAWMMNDQPIPPKHGAPLRLIIPFRYGNRSIKAITEISFATPGLPMPPLPG